MLANYLGSALGIGSSIFGGIMGAIAAKRQKKAIEKQQEKNDQWFKRRYNEDATQRADAVRMLNQTRDLIRERNKNAAGTAAVMGSSDTAIAAEKAANNGIIADVTSKIVADNEARKDMLEQTYLGRDDNYQQQLNQIQQNKATNISNAVSGVANAVSKFF